MRPLRWWPLLLVPSGFVAGHELGYQAATALGRAPVPGGHAYLGGLALVGAPFAFAAVARSLLAALRDELPTVPLSAAARSQEPLCRYCVLCQPTATSAPPL